MAEEAVQGGNQLEVIAEFDGELFTDLKAMIEPFYVEDPNITIYKLPEPILKVEEDVYQTRYMSLVADTTYDLDLIRDESKRAHSIRHLHSILTRNPNRTLEDYLMAMYEMKVRIKRCHYVEIEIDFQRLIWLVVDGCFIVDVLLMFYEGRLTPKVDSICASNLHYLWIDLLLVENQYPFFAAEKIFDMVVEDKSEFPSLVELALNLFDNFIQRDLQKPVMDSKSVHHLLHLVHHQLLLSNPSKPLSSILNRSGDSPLPLLPVSNRSPSKQLFIMKPIPSARMLQDVGIKFKKKEGSGFQDVSFKNGVLEIPHLYVHSNTKVLLRNLIAWEQCHHAAGTYFTSYAIFIDYIVNTEKDIEILSEAGIIEHSLSSDEDVADIFNGLSMNLVHTGLDDSFLPELTKQLNHYCQSNVNKWWAKLMNDYFSNPWSIVSVVAAIVLLVLTFVQTFFSAFSYFQPPQ